MKEKSRFSWLGLLKFLASLMIIWCHTSLLRNGEEYSFKYTYLLVDFFFMISGFFVFRHFQKEEYQKLSINEAAKESLKYTFKRFLGYLPYVVVSVLTITAITIVNAHPVSIGGLVAMMKITPFELLFLSSQTGLRLSPIWYLSSLFIVMPFFSLLSQKVPKYLNYLLSLLFVIISYNNFFQNMDKFEGLQALLRAITGLSLGVVIYMAAEYINGCKFKKWQEIIITITEIIILLSAIVLMYPANVEFVQAKPSESLIILLFSISLILLLSQKSYTSKIRFGLFDFLEKLSLPIYITHWVVIRFIQYYLPEMSINKRIAVLYIATFIASISLYSMIELYKTKQYLKRISK